MTSFGWDVSTSVIGATAFDGTGKWIETIHIDLRKVDPGIFNKVAVAREPLIAFVKKHAVSDGRSRHFVEDRLANFSFGKTSMNTLMTLAAFNALVSYIVWRAARSDLLPIHPSTVKALMRREGLVIPPGGDKKIATLEFVVAREPGFEVFRNRTGKYQAWMFDRADSYVVAKAGMTRADDPGAKAKDFTPRIEAGGEEEG